jgi:hypothetical protein
MPPKKRGRDTAAAEDATLSKGAGNNDDIIAAFETLMFYESKLGNSFAGVAYNKVVKAIRGHGSVIAAGADVAKLAGVGKASVEKIDELLATGKLKKVDEFAAIYGPVPDEIKAAMSLTTSGGKSAGGKKGAAAKSVGKPLKGTPMPAATKKKVATLATELAGKLKTDALKATLKANGQSTTGAKDELVQRCAQGAIMGRIPTCPLCSGGKLKYDAATGIYACPGYMDDADFRPCFFKSADVTRGIWVE